MCQSTQPTSHVLGAEPVRSCAAVVIVTVASMSP